MCVCRLGLTDRRINRFNDRIGATRPMNKHTSQWCLRHAYTQLSMRQNLQHTSEFDTHVTCTQNERLFTSSFLISPSLPRIGCPAGRRYSFYAIYRSINLQLHSAPLVKWPAAAPHLPHTLVAAWLLLSNRGEDKPQQ